MKGTATKTIHESESTPKADGFRMPGGFENGLCFPQYGDENDALAVQQIQAAFDAAYGEGVYKAVGVRTDQIVFGGGNIHCITQQEPADK